MDYLGNDGCRDVDWIWEICRKAGRDMDSDYRVCANAGEAAGISCPGCEPYFWTAPQIIFRPVITSADP